MKKYPYSKAASQEEIPILKRLQRSHTLLNPAVDPGNPEWHEMSFKSRRLLDSISESRSFSTTGSSLSSDKCFSTSSAPDTNSQASTMVISDNDLASSWLYKIKRGKYEIGDAEGDLNEVFDSSPTCSAGSPLLTKVIPPPPPPPPPSPAPSPLLSFHHKKQLPVLPPALIPKEDSDDELELPKLKLKPVPVARKQRSNCTSCCYFTVTVLVCLCLFGLFSSIGGILYMEYYAPQFARQLTGDTNTPKAPTASKGLSSKSRGVSLEFDESIQNIPADSDYGINIKSTTGESKDREFDSNEDLRSNGTTSEDAHPVEAGNNKEIVLGTLPDPLTQSDFSRRMGEMHDPRIDSVVNSDSGADVLRSSKIPTTKADVDSLKVVQGASRENFQSGTNGITKPSQDGSFVAIQKSGTAIDDDRSPLSKSRNEKTPNCNPSLGTNLGKSCQEPSPVQKSSKLTTSETLHESDSSRKNSKTAHQPTALSSGSNRERSDFEMKAHEPDSSQQSMPHFQNIPGKITPAAVTIKHSVPRLTKARSPADRFPATGSARATRQPIFVRPIAINSNPNDQQQAPSLFIKPSSIANFQRPPRKPLGHSSTKMGSKGAGPVTYMQIVPKTPFQEHLAGQSVVSPPFPSEIKQTMARILPETAEPGKSSERHDAVTDSTISLDAIVRPSEIEFDSPQNIATPGLDLFVKSLRKPAAGVPMQSGMNHHAREREDMQLQSGFGDMLNMLKQPNAFPRLFVQPPEEVSIDTDHILPKQLDSVSILDELQPKPMNLQESIARALKRFQSLEHSSLPGSRHAGTSKGRRPQNGPSTSDELEKKLYLDKLRVMLYDSN